MAAKEMTLRERVLADMSRRLLAIKSERYAGDRPMFEVAVERGHWDLAAHCLLVGAVEALSDVPPNALDALMEEIEGELPASGAPRRHGRRETNGRRQ